MATELGGTQISNLLETLPGIANVLRSPVADAMINVIRAAARLEEFNLSDAEELIQYATRRGLVGTGEGEQVLSDAREAYQKRADRAADRARPARSGGKAGVSKARKPRPKARAKPKAKAKPKPKPKPRAKKKR